MSSILHEHQVDKLCAADGFRRNKMSRVLQREYGWDFSRPGIVPDCWKIVLSDVDPNKLICAEVEFTSRLNDEKIWKYANFWADVDAENSCLEVWIFDRFGNKVGVLDDEFWCHTFYRLNYPQFFPEGRKQPAKTTSKRILIPGKLRNKSQKVAAA